MFRIGHIGYYDVFDITTALAAVETLLVERGVELERGRGRRARARGLRRLRACRLTRRRPPDRAFSSASRSPSPGLELLEVEVRRRRGRDERPRLDHRRLRRDRHSLGDDRSTRPMIERAERLKVIGRAGVGIDNVDVDAATRRGIVVANAPESTVVSAAEHTRRAHARARAQRPAGTRSAEGRALGAVAVRGHRARRQDARRARARAHRAGGRAARARARDARGRVRPVRLARAVPRARRRVRRRRRRSTRRPT